MVSFQCENCTDVVKKPKLDAHRGRCHNASYSCLDCGVHFHGTDYRSHTSCITEDQKYQGALYKEKTSRASKRKSVSIVEPNEDRALVPRPAYVEDEVDPDAPPRAPSPPPAVPESVNVFDYLVNEDSPRNSRSSLSNGKKQLPPALDTNFIEAENRSNRPSHRDSEETLNTKEYEQHGFSYGAEPLLPRSYQNSNPSTLSLDFMTPAAKATRAKLDRKERPSLSHSRQNSGSIGKRKRASADNHVNGGSYEIDTPMPDVHDDLVGSAADTPLALAHSGLTGGLGRLTSKDEEYPSLRSSPDPRDRRPDSRHSNKRDDPESPQKRSRRSKEDNYRSNSGNSNHGSNNGLGISIKGRAGKVMSLVGAAFNPAAAHNQGLDRGTNAVSRTRRQSSSSDQAQDPERGDERRERASLKKHRVHRHNGTSSANVRDRSGRSRRSSHQSPESTRRKVRAIEYHQASADVTDSDSDEPQRGKDGQMVIFGAASRTKLRCETFFSFVNKGPDSEKGCSINKALKRWHRDSDTRSLHGKQEEEKELWRSLRLKRNDRGEIVVFF